MSDEVNKVPVYAEPEGIDYIIIKVKESVINSDRGGSLYEATRRAWHAKLESAMPYKLMVLDNEVHSAIVNIADVLNRNLENKKPTGLHDEEYHTRPINSNYWKGLYNVDC